MVVVPREKSRNIVFRPVCEVIKRCARLPRFLSAVLLFSALARPWKRRIRVICFPEEDRRGPTRFSGPSIVRRRESALVPRAEKPVPQRTRFRCAPSSDTRGRNSSVARTKEDGRSRACNEEGVNNNNDESSNTRRRR